MQSLFRSFVLILVLTYSTGLIAQTKQEVFSSLEKIIKRADGQKVEARGLVKPDKVTKQQFNESFVAVATKNTAKNSTESSYTFSEIPWAELYKYTIDQDDANDDVYEVTMYFDKHLKTTYRSDYNGEGEHDKTIFINVYIRTKDFNDFDRQVKLLGTVIPNKIR